MKHVWLLVVFCTIIAVPERAPAQRKAPPLVQQVKNGIDSGVKFLKGQQNADGGWYSGVSGARYKGGWSSLAVLALLTSGVSPDDEHVKRGLNYLRALRPSTTYVRALQTMVFVEARQKEDLERIANNIQWLIEARVMNDGVGLGWTYTKGSSLRWDGSNTQYALLGLWAGQQAGVQIKQELWKSIRDFYIRNQVVNNNEGFFRYAQNSDGPGAESRFTMTTAGLCGLLIAGMELNLGRETIQPNGAANNCGKYAENTPVKKALNWISGREADRFRIDLPQRVFYSLYGVERAGRLTGLRFFGAHDWYREGCEYLVKNQREDGSWWLAGTWDKYPVVSTSFALLFLSKGRTPVLVSKMVHGAWPRRDSDTDWNNDRNDLRHLVDYASKELFNEMPMAWQNFDVMRAGYARPNVRELTNDDLLEVTSEMLQSPILYITGHEALTMRLTGSEKKVLKFYIENGGFIFAEACCNRPAFDRGFKELVRELWPDGELVLLGADHPIWDSHFPVKPGDPYKLMGLRLGCKTVLIYSPQDLSCMWESKRLDLARGKAAFRLGVNMIRYVTGKTPPKPKLTNVRVVRKEEKTVTPPRGYFKIAQVKYGIDWQPAPRAMPNLMRYMRDQFGFDVVVQTETMRIESESIKDFKLVYLHGRETFKFADEELEILRFNLKNGGLMFADACCGKQTFDDSFRKFMKVLFPKHKLERIPLDDILFSKKLNGDELTDENIRARTQRNSAMRNVSPYLEGVKVGGRWVVIYSKYDIGCALERHQSSECVGYDPDSAERLAAAAVMYLFRP